MSNPDKEIIEKINQLIQENIENAKFSVDDVCQNLGLSRTQLHRAVKEQTQLSTSLYIRKIKLQKAKELLATTGLRISEITYAIGIDSPQSFSKYFIDEFGISPSDFRKSNWQNSKDTAAEKIQEIPEKLIQPPVPKPNYRWLGLGILLIIALGVWAWLQTSASNVESSIAILPFKNLGSAETAYFSDGVMEQIHASLARIDKLKIISKSSSAQYKDTKKSTAQIAKELNVNYILEGTVLQVGQKVRITVELIRANDNRTVWSNNYEGEMKDIFGYMSAVAKEMASELNQKLSATLSKKLEKVPTQNLNAYNEYLQGEQLIKARTKEKIEAGILKLDKAIGLDPNFADAYAYKALAYYLLGEDNYIDTKKSIKLVEQNALIAIQLDAENGVAYASLGKGYQEQNKWEQANTSFQIALKNSPNDAQINYWYSLMLRSIGEFDAAIRYSTKAVALDPLYPSIWVGHIGNCIYAGKLEMAKKSIDEGKLLFSDFYMYYWATGYYYISLKDFKTALSEFKKGDQLANNVKAFKTMIAYCQAKLGQKEPVENYLKLLPNIPNNYDSFAVVYAGLGDTEHCINYLQKGAEVDNLPNYIKISPLFTFLHADARFTAVLQKIGLDNPKFKVL